MKPLTKRIIVIGFALFLAVPLVVGLAGFRPDTGENRAAAGYPDFGPDTVLDAETYRGLSAFLRDRLPFRDIAIEADARIDVDLFGDNPNPAQVVIGEDDWLFLRASLGAPCAGEPEPMDEVFDQLDIIARAVESSGRTFRLIVAPDKVSVYGEFLGEGVQSPCQSERRFSQQTRLQAGLVPGFVDLWRVFDEESDDVLYYKGDTHWTELGASLFVRELVESLQPGIWDQDAVVRTPGGGREAGLRSTLGLPGYETADAVTIRRPGVAIQTIEEWEVSSEGEVTAAPDDDPYLVISPDRAELAFTVPQVGRAKYPHRRTTTIGGELIEGTTLILQDSFMWDPLEMLPAYFTEIIYDHWRIVHQDQFRQDLLRADTVVVETVERNLLGRIAEGRLFESVLIGLAPDLPGFDVPIDGDMLRRSLDAELTSDGIVSTSGEGRIEIAQVPPAPSGASRYVLVTVRVPEDTTFKWSWANDEGRVVAANTIVYSPEEGTSVIIIDMNHAPDSVRYRIRAQRDGLEVLAVKVVDIPA